MKKLLLALLVFPVVAMGQTFHKNVDEINVTPPVFTGVQKVVTVPESAVNYDPLEAFLIDNFNYPDAAVECQIEGTGIVQFTVHSNGKLADFRVINSVCPAIDQAFIKVLKSTEGMWNPGFNNDKPTAMETEVSMMFVANQTIRQNPQAYFMTNAKKLCAKGNKLFLANGKVKKALNFYDKSIKYMPYETSSLLMRGLCRFELGDEKGACSDWNRINAIGRYDADPFIENLCGLKGYAEMTQILNINPDK